MNDKEKLIDRLEQMTDAEIAAFIVFLQAKGQAFYLAVQPAPHP